MERCVGDERGRHIGVEGVADWVESEKLENNGLLRDDTIALLCTNSEDVSIMAAQ